MFGDQPIRDAKDDRFRRAAFAHRIADTILHRQDAAGLVLGLYGAWGTGKTSLMNLIRARLSGEKGVITTSFNPWHYGSKERILEALFQEISALLGEHASRNKQKLADALKVIGGFTSQGIAEAGKWIGESTLEKERDLVGKYLREHGVMAVVLVDDVDRLDHQETHALFSALKLSASFENVVYVIACDHHAVAASLSRRYGSEPTSGYDFLEKIVQVPLHVPPVQRRTLVGLAFEGIDQVLRDMEYEFSVELGHEFAYHFEQGCGQLLRTPRMVKRYINALAFRLGLLRGECSVVDTMLLEAIRVLAPVVYENLSLYRDLLVGRVLESDARRLEDRKKFELECRNAVGDSDWEILKRALQYLFPRLQSETGSLVFGDSTVAAWHRKKRVCTRAYFDRYFHYGIPASDVSDADVEDFIQNSVELGAEDASTRLRSMCEDNGAPKLVQKLRSRVSKCSPKQAESMLDSLLRIGDEFRYDEFSFASTYEQAAVLVRELVAVQTSDHKRKVLAYRVVRHGAPLSFAANCLSWISSSREEDGEKPVLDEASENRVRRELVKRIRREFKETPPYLQYTHGGSTILWTWARVAGAADVGTALKRRFKAHPTEISKFLVSMCPISSSSEIQYLHRGVMEPEQWARVFELVPEPEVRRAIDQGFDEAYTNPGEDQYADMKPEQRVVVDFMRRYGDTNDNE